VGSFLNLAATARWLAQQAPEHIILICAGTAEFTALEDVLAAGALCDALPGWSRSDAAELAWRAYQDARTDLAAAVNRSRNGSRLLANPELRPDVAVCLERDRLDLVAGLDAAGVVRHMV
jgi:phosphosulfolactate phosphohydrolase-like enzyme